MRAKESRGTSVSRTCCVTRIPGEVALREFRIRLVGEHSAYHCGSAAAYQALTAACVVSGRIVGDDEDFDILVVNGEGSMHHDSSSCRKKLLEMKAALDAGKRVHLVNTVWQDNAPEAAEVLSRCESITAREVMSQHELRRIGVDCNVALDQSFFLPIDEAAPGVDFAGAPVLTDFFSSDLGTFARITTQWTWQVPYVQMHEWSWAALVKSLRSASVLLTGRHHAVYAACRARVPFLALKGNTHKIEGLIATSGVDIPVYASYPELLKAYRAKAWLKHDYGALFEWMHAQRAWEMSR